MAQALQTPTVADVATPGLLCLAHLGWDHVWQRPQHILSRLARHYPALYVNEPRIGNCSDNQPQLELIAEEGNLAAWQPVFPDSQEVGDRWREMYAGVVQDLLLSRGWLRPTENGFAPTRPLVSWFYTPVPYYLLDHLPACLVVYDVMDELANFRHAAHDIKEREARMLARADVVFVGGRSLYEARVGKHANLHLFPSGVELEHFVRVLRSETEVAPEIGGLPRPVLGYYGVVDERLDLDLLRALASEHLSWPIAIIGPVAKIRPEDLPDLPNIHYLGKQPYSRLPNLLKGIDVCLMPFAVNEATRYISPTKALEYMAAHKPIVSTPVPDVVSNWGHVVYVAPDVAGFAVAVEQALSESPQEAAERIARSEAILARSTWDQIASDMRDLLAAALEKNLASVSAGSQ